jgi:hypothetical protein
MTNDAPKIIKLTMEFVCPSIDSAQAFAEECYHEFFTPEGPNVPKMTKWNIAEDDIDVVETEMKSISDIGSTN